MAWQAGVFHNPSGIYLEKPPSGLGSEATLRLRVPHGAPVEKVFLRSAPDGEQHMEPLRRGEPIPGWDCEWWELTFKVLNERFHYRFFLLGGAGGWWYNAAEISRVVPTDHSDFQLLASQRTVAWLEHAVFYQIFPDRFADGDPSNNVRNGAHTVDGKPVVARSWGELPKQSQGGREFYGGDLQGITQHLSHLHETLGVNAVYLNPIGTAPSNHKYDVASYTDVDPYLGGEPAFLELRRALSERDMRLILDIVPNHCGNEHPWFKQAQRDPQAASAEFFNFHRRPDEYDCWLGIRTLPKLNYDSQALRDAMYAGPDAVMRQWLRPPRAIDGWRIDVANMLARQGARQLGHKILRGMRRAVKAENPDCYLLGENFFDASSYLQGDQLDATMNYRGFMMPLYHWLTGIDYNAMFEKDWGDRHPIESAELERTWRAFRSFVPWGINRQQFNLLDSHDTPRLLTLVGGDRARAAVARLLLFTYPGVPCIYYGDEIGLEGGRDPDNRRTMDWDVVRWDQDWLNQWSQLISLRKTSDALARGSMQMVLAERDTIAFMRETREQRLLIIARRGDDGLDRIPLVNAAVPDGTRFHEYFTGQDAEVQNGGLTVGPSRTQIWRELR